MKMTTREVIHVLLKNEKQLAEVNLNMAEKEVRSCKEELADPTATYTARRVAQKELEEAKKMLKTANAWHARVADALLDFENQGLL